jgi:hypothetical protein
MDRRRVDELPAARFEVLIEAQLASFHVPQPRVSQQMVPAMQAPSAKTQSCLVY